MLIWVDQRWRKRLATAMAVMSGFCSGWYGFFFFFFLLWSGLIGGVWVFVPVGFWWLIWVDQRWRKHWSSGGSGGGVWVLIGLIWVFFSCCDQGWSVMSGFLFWWDFGGWSGLINDGGNVDLAGTVATVSGFWSGLIWFFFSPVVIGVDRWCLGFCFGGILVVDLGWSTMEETLI